LRQFLSYKTASQNEVASIEAKKQTRPNPERDKQAFYFFKRAKQPKEPLNLMPIADEAKGKKLLIHPPSG